MELLGGFAAQTVEVVNRLGKQLARQTARDEALVTHHLYQRLSITLMKANSALITSRSPTNIPGTIDGDRDFYIYLH